MSDISKFLFDSAGTQSFVYLVKEVQRSGAEFEFELSRCHDMYRLAHLMDAYMTKLELIKADVDEAVSNLEGGEDAV